MQDNKGMWGIIIVSGFITLALIIAVFVMPEPPLDNVEAQALYFEVRRLLFAAGVLGVLAFLLILGIVVYIWGPVPEGGGDPPGRLVFDSLIKVIPPIITLVLGFYFGQQVGKTTAEKQQQLEQKQHPSQSRSQPSLSATPETTGKTAPGEAVPTPSTPQQPEKE